MRFLSCFSGIEAASVAWCHLGWKCVGVAEIEPFPCAALAHHYPDVPNLGNVLADDFLDRADALQPDVLVGGPPCFVAGTLILTRAGLVPIEDITEGDEVLTHHLRWRRVVATMRREAETFLVRGQGHHGIETTAKHPFYARHVRKDWIVGSKKIGGPCWRRVPEEPEWVEARDLLGLFWSSPATIPGSVFPADIGGNSLFPRPLTPELMWVLGAWLGDGWIRNTRKQAHLLLCSAKHEAEAVEARLRNAGFDPWCSDERTTARFAFGDRALTEWIVENFGRGAARKSIPTWLLCSAEPLRRAFFDGYLHADGATVRQSKGGGTVHTFTTISKGIAIGLRLLANTLELSCTVSFVERPPEHVIEGRTVRQSNTYQVRVYESARSAFLDNGMMWGKVRRAFPTGHRSEVFNFEVEEDNSYVADGLVVHNCQDFSIAGLRSGLGGSRGNLSLRWVEIIRAVRPSFSVTENVPGWLSVNGGHAFGAFLAGLVGHDSAILPPKSCGGRWTDAGMVAGPLGRVAWRILDAQYFGLAQRRKRVFVVFCPRDGADPAAVLFEPASLRGNPPPGREAREGIARTLTGGSGKRGWSGDNGSGQGCELIASTISACTKGSGGLGTDFDCDGGLVAATTTGHGWWKQSNIAGTLLADTSASDGGINTTLVSAYRTNAAGQIDCQGDKAAALTGMSDPCAQFLALDSLLVAHALRSEGFDASEDGTGRGTPTVPVSVALRGRDGGGSIELGDDLAYALRSSHKPHVLAFSAKDSCADAQLNLSPTLRAGVHYASHANGRVMPAVQCGMVVRRLTPRECERLQGFRDDYTLVPYRGSLAADGPRYKALGNSMAVPVMSWIGRRISMADKFGGSDVAHETGDICRNEDASSDAQCA